MLDLISNFFEKTYHQKLYLEVVALPNDDTDLNRLLIRKKMDDYLNATYGASDIDLMDTINVPQAISLPEKTLHASISHTGKMALFAISDIAIGIDIEDPLRISEKVV
ncbi:MAG: hypothetical protein KDD45_00800, partial [Bdellovibrionales bacterium]|nr:hypothetical protein [Bdellovibrionales bacterium]